jgi:hypothetical protein
MSSEATDEKQYPQIVEELAKRGMEEITIEEKIHHYFDSSSSDSYILHREPSIIIHGNETITVYVDFSQKAMKDFLQRASKELGEAFQNHSHNWAMCKREIPLRARCIHCDFAANVPSIRFAVPSRPSEQRKVQG